MSQLQIDPNSYELKKLELRTKRLLNADLIGNYRSAFRGSGLLFSEVREYVPGDEIRHIHWKCSARTGRTYIKTFEEDRSLNIQIMLDISSSLAGGAGWAKHEGARRFAAVISLLGTTNQDAVGLTLFAGDIISFDPPKRSRSQSRRILERLLEPPQLSPSTDIALAINHLNKQRLKNGIVFIISDFISPTFEYELGILSRKHDVIGVMVENTIDESLPNIGLVSFEDPETGEELTIDTSSKQNQIRLKLLHNNRKAQLKSLFRKYHCDFITVGDSPIPPLRQLIAERVKRVVR